MKKSILYLLCFGLLACVSAVKAEEKTVTIEVPASSLEKIDVKYEQKTPSKTEKAIDATKDATDKTINATKKATKKTVDATKDFTDKAVKSTKEATKKTVDATKDFTDKAVKSTKDATKKTVDATKDFTDKAVENTKEILDNINPNRPVTLEGLEAKSEIKILKGERDELKAAYNSRIKDINAKIKAAQKATTLSDVQRQSKIYTLNKEKSELIDKRDKMIERYNDEIDLIKIKSKNKKES